MQPDDTIWGNINTCFEIMLEIYYITAENKKGIVMSKKQAESSLSDEALKKGEVKDDYIYFDENNMNIPFYELMQKRLDEKRFNTKYDELGEDCFDEQI